MTTLTHFKTGETLNNIDMIDLQSAHVTQITSGAIKGEWEVKKNVTGDKLHSFPPTINDKDMFDILNFAKRYELIAFNAGISFQKGKQNELLAAKIKDLTRINKELADENIRLATILENLLPEE